MCKIWLRVLFVEILAEVPDRLNLRKQISRTRLRNLPPNPFRLSDLQDILTQHQQTLNGSNFLLYDSLDDDNDDIGRILIFATADNLVQLFKCNVWFVDGTFKTAPSLFFQLFPILGAVKQTGIIVNRKLLDSWKINGKYLTRRLHEHRLRRSKQTRT